MCQCFNQEVIDLLTGFELGPWFYIGHEMVSQYTSQIFQNITHSAWFLQRNAKFCCTRGDHLNITLTPRGFYSWTLDSTF